MKEQNNNTNGWGFYLARRKELAKQAAKQLLDN